MRRPNQNVMDAMLGLAGGVMVAAAFWSLLSPAIDMAQALGMVPWLTVFVGFLGGGILLFFSDRLFTKLQEKRALLQQGQTQAGLKRCAMLVFSITPAQHPGRDGHWGGLWFPGLWAGGLHRRRGLDAGPGHRPAKPAGGHGGEPPPPPPGGIRSPTGLFLRPTQRRGGTHRRRRAGALLVLKIQVCLPFLLAFAAGAMIYVVVEELIPESQTNENKDWMALFTLVGFSVMMVLDVALG